MADEIKSSADQLYEDAKAHFDNVENPHKVEKTYIHGLWNVENTSDLDKPISTAIQTNLDGKFAISEIYNSLEENNSIDLTKVPLSAAQGKVLSESIGALEDIDETISDLDARITALENWQ